jgi:ATP-dependent Clp protease ATP-binding subunit ClpC
VLQLTAEESDRLQHSYIGTEHILLALVGDAEAAGDHFFSVRGVALDALRAKVLRYIVDATTAVEPGGAGNRAGTSLARQDARARIRGYLDEIASLSDGDARVLHLVHAIHLELESLEPTS